MAIHILLPTLQGLSAVQGIVREDPDVPSVVCLNGTAQSLPISNAYYDFVKKGQGVIGRDFGHEAWRIDLSDPVEMGNSWQLGLYLAHYFFELGQLGSGEPVAGDTVLWVTGAVKSNHQVEPVEGVERKLLNSTDNILAWQKNSIKTIAVMCAANHALVNLPDNVTRVDIENVKELSSLTKHLSIKSNLSSSAQTKNKFPWRMMSAIAVLIVASAYGITKYQQRIPTKQVFVVQHSDQLPPQKSQVISTDDLKEASQNKAGVERVTVTTSNLKLPLMHVKKVAVHEQCEKNQIKISLIESNKQNHFNKQSLNQLCALGFEFKQNEVVFVTAYAMDSRHMISMERVGNLWVLPLPKDQSKDRHVALIVYKNIAPTDDHLKKLKRFLGFHIDGGWMDADDITQEFQQLGWHDMKAYSHTLSSFTP